MKYITTDAIAELDYASTKLEISVLLDYAIVALVILIVIYIFFIIYQNQIEK